MARPKQLEKNRAKAVAWLIAFRRFPGTSTPPGVWFAFKLAT